MRHDLFDWQTLVDAVRGIPASFMNSTPAKMWAAFLICGLVVEVLIKAEKGQPFKAILFNVRYSAIYLAVIFIASPALNTAINAIAQRLGLGWVNLDFFRQDSLWQQISAGVVYLLIVDFFYYWWHRWQHVVPWLWDQHVIHHSDESLNVSTSMRHHWSEFIFQGFLITLPMIVLFKLTPVSMWVVSTVVSAWSWFIHMNIRLHLGRWSWLIAGPQLHRIHHSRELQHFDKNFAAYFPIWDVLFGSYYHPGRDEYPKTGVADVRFETIGQASAHPLRQWIRRIKKKLPSRPSGLENARRD